MNSADWDDDDASSASSPSFNGFGTPFGFSDGRGSIDLSELQSGCRPISGAAYELIRRLDDGTSGFGQVWEAHNERLRHTVVFKFCKNPLAPENILTLHNELRLVRGLDHPGVVKLEAEYLDNPIPFLQYEYVDGVDLAKLLEARFGEGGGGPLAPEHAAAVILRLADILAFAHSRPTPIVHRDIKPQNILVANHRVLSVFRELGAEPDLRLAELKVMDFGIGAHSRYGARATSGSRSIGVLFDGFRSHAYASPQQNQGLPAHESDDVYALGVMWLELLTGRLGEGPPLGRQWRRTRDELEARGLSQPHLDLLETCLEPSREHRISNAIQLSKRIQGLDNPPAPAPPLADALAAVIKGRDRSPSLDRLSTLPVEVAEILAGWCRERPSGGPGAFPRPGESYLRLNGLGALPAETARALAAGRPSSLELNGLSALPVESAEALAAWRGRFLDLKGLTPAAKDELRAKPSLLHSACRQEGRGMVRFLLNEIGIDKNCVDDDGFACLHIAVREGHETRVKYLIELGVDANTREARGGNTALHLAAAAGGSEIVGLLLEGGADMSLRNLEGKTPLHCAIDSGDIDTIRLLAPK